MSAQTRLEALKLAVSVKGLVGVDNVMEAALRFDDYMNDVRPVAPEPEITQTEPDQNTPNRRKRRS